ncbi:MAG: hypothetical protein AB7N80_10255 [Bdellovibrionales bacterium]
MKFVSVLLMALLMTALGFSGQAQAQSGLLFSPSVMFFSYQDRDGGSDIAKVDAQYIDVRLGYITSMNLYVGGLYTQMKREDGTTNRERTSMGASAGLVYNRFFLIGHYILSSEFEISSGSSLEDGTGVQVDLGYWFNVSGSFYAGPQVVYRKIDYDKKNGVAVQDSNSKETVPYLSLAFIF